MTIQKFNQQFKPGQVVSAIRGDGKRITGQIEGPDGKMAWNAHGVPVVIVSGEAVPIRRVREV